MQLLLDIQYKNVILSPYGEKMIPCSSHLQNRISVTDDSCVFILKHAMVICSNDGQLTHIEFLFLLSIFNTLRLRQNSHDFADYMFKCIFVNENVWISIWISLLIPKGPVNNIPTLVEIMAWCRPGDKPLSQRMMGSLLMHICVTRPQYTHCDLMTAWSTLGR